MAARTYTLGEVIAFNRRERWYCSAGATDMLICLPVFHSFLEGQGQNHARDKLFEVGYVDLRIGAEEHTGKGARPRSASVITLAGSEFLQFQVMARPGGFRHQASALELGDDPRQQAYLSMVLTTPR